MTTRQVRGKRHRPGGQAKALARTGLLLLLTLAQAQAEEARNEPFQVGPGDKLSVTVFGQPDMTGEYLVGDDGRIIFPLIGEVQVGNATLGEVQKRFVAQLQDGYLVNPAVTVRIVELRPVYVVGDVRTPGSYPFRFGASVMSAIALAGGLGTPDQSTSAARAELITADERVRVLEGKLGALTLKLARLQAQQAEETKFEAPQPAGMSTDEYEDTLRREREILAADSRAVLQELTILRQQKPRIEADKQAVEVQRQAEQLQLDLIREHIAGYSTLMAQGYARRYTGIELQREEARNRGNVARLTSELTRLDLSLLETDLRIQTTMNGYRRRLIAEAEDTVARMAEIRATLPSAREILATRLQQGGGILPDGTRPKPAISITRMRDGSSATFAAQETSSIRPGDIVEVRLQSLERTPRDIGPPARRNTAAALP